MKHETVCFALAMAMDRGHIHADQCTVHTQLRHEKCDLPLSQHVTHGLDEMSSTIRQPSIHSSQFTIYNYMHVRAIIQIHIYFQHLHRFAFLHVVACLFARFDCCICAFESTVNWHDLIGRDMNVEEFE